MSSPASPAPAQRAVRPALVLLGVLAVAVNLRAALAGYPPLLETIRAELGVGSGAAGLVQAGAVLMMSAGSFGAAALTARIGRERLLGIAVVTIAVGSLLRSVAALPALVGGSVLVGLGIGIAGVQLTGVVKEHLADRAGAVTGAYVVAMMVGATIASAVAVPLAVLLGGWSFSLAVWAVPAMLALAAWIPVASRIGRSRTAAVAPDPHTAGVPVRATWRDPFARWTACYLVGSSTAFYGWLTWLSPYYESQGWSPQAAGLLLAVWSVSQIPVALLVPAAAERRRRWQFWASLSVLSTVAGTAGALLLPAPETALPWVWTVLIGFGVGSGLPLGLTVIAWRTSTPARSAAVSGFALGIGYLAAGLGPPTMGVLIDLGGFGPAIGLLVAAGLVQGLAVARIGNRPS
ncbi:MULTISPECIES: MFS transporter [Pseudonocardia]|uniref:MFS transporter n=2 Tax=Pseudonocardia TaxID=1847 RepID=A0ABQ0RWD6_9PSEU|nr:MULTISPECIES: MFS transporter [Pseudonocardia]OSY42426.1 putative transporter YycB [Pseudonocardia autotrophica]TDN75946.1 CP family cyanate transporter-like MFS transporter [Pseudonocardia autotrophica]BBF99918.1 MFS transporter [Pseudonocardia autotrophica]GEC24977.1 MFS transporter [Pseudonocardia saturnea]